jgi:hypothetical protein
MIVRGMFGLVVGRERAAIRRMQAKLGQSEIVKGGSFRQLGARDRQK